MTPPTGSPAARLPPATRVYAIGDIHGRDDLLATMHARIAADAAGFAGRRVVVYLGDYVSRGPASRAVVDRVRGWRPEGFEIVTLKGNHEDLLLRFVGGDLEAGDHWFHYGGVDTLASYGVDGAGPGREAAVLETLRRQFVAALPAGHLDFFSGLRVHHGEGDYRFVHAGVVPGVPLAEQSELDQMWIRQRFLESDRDHGAVIVHGHCIAAQPEVRHNRIGIDTGAYRSGVLTCLVLDATTCAFLQT